MATVSSELILNDYPTSDGRPMAETDWHRILMTTLIQTLDAWYARDPMVYVSGNLLLFYERGNKRRHVSPDVFVVKGVAKRRRPNYLIWEEAKGPDIVIELTSSSTRGEDVKKKFHLYQDNLRVQEYFLFDPLGDYLDPALRGYRLQRGRYTSIREIEGRLPSKVLGLHLEAAGEELRLFDPTTSQLLTPPEERTMQAEAQRDQEHAARLQAETERDQERAARLKAETELARLRREIGHPRRGNSK
jgi:Uma2 family endonuclease